MSLSGRPIAASVIRQVMSAGRSLSSALDEACEPLTDPRERSLARELAFGVCRWLPRLSAILPQLLERPLRRKDLDVQVVLLLGLYQLLYTRIPEHAAVAESVSLVRTLGKPWSAGLVNAVLRRFQRERAQILDAVGGNEEAEFAHPAWIIDVVKKAWPEDWRKVLEAGNIRPPMTLRVNRRQTTQTDYMKRLAEAGFKAGPALHTTHGVVLDTPVDVERLPGFEAGAVSVQDAAAQLAAPLLRLTPGLRVLDACAAPGGKTAHILESEPALAELVAVDKTAERIPRLRATLSRLALECTVINADAAHPAKWWDGQPFDRILLDAPCTASGVIRRHPDIKFHRRPDDVDRQAATQRLLLEALWPLLARGGMVLYATCSILPQENQHRVAEFVEARADVELWPMESDWGRPVEPGRQILPGEHGMDGFYYALLAKCR